MILLNVLYGFIIATIISLAYMAWNYTADFNGSLFFYVWMISVIANTVYDFAAHWTVRFFNQNRVITRSDMDRLR